VYGFVAGLGGRDVTFDTIRAALERPLTGEAPRAEGTWLEE
jgi:hypothetical protein